ncbi:MAG TPA: TdeIII family type II restriction endonuclease [Pyrinomonadaceae bacterium]|jgi:hypothetical protein
MSSQHDEIKIGVESIVRALVDDVGVRAAANSSYEVLKSNPLYTSLVSEELFRLSFFQQRIVESLGKGWELLIALVAQRRLGYAVAGYKIRGNVRSGRLKRIRQVIGKLQLNSYKEEGEKERPDWEKELAYVLAGKGELLPVIVDCGVYAKNKRGNERYVFELEAPLPNSDQTKVSKEKILKLYAMEPVQVDGAYYALPYNPYGRKENYAWSFPSRWFNMKEDEVVLIGDEFWEKVGGKGTYQSFINAVNEIGKDYRDRIYREFLGIEPPSSGDDARL